MIPDKYYGTIIIQVIFFKDLALFTMALRLYFSTDIPLINPLEIATLLWGIHTSTDKRRMHSKPQNFPTPLSMTRTILNP